jgi:hypothetical protein
MWIFELKELGDLNRMGRIFLEKVAEQDLALTPIKYEVCVTPEEFWG